MEVTRPPRLQRNSPRLCHLARLFPLSHLRVSGESGGRNRLILTLAPPPPRAEKEPGLYRTSSVCQRLGAKDAGVRKHSECTARPQTITWLP